MPVLIGAKPESGFDDPMGLMTDCHRRIERFLDTLRSVARNAADRELTDEEARAVGTALTYFRDAAPRHTADEEDSLFPRLRGAPSSDVISMLPEVSALNADHEIAAMLHQSTDTTFRRWLQGRKLDPRESQQLQADLRSLCQLYKKHIAVEESIVFPLARRILNSSAQLAMGEEMKCRRGMGPQAGDAVRKQVPGEHGSPEPKPATA
jgi:hemerythrin-like domain-containing protein